MVKRIHLYKTVRPFVRRRFACARICRLLREEDSYVAHREPHCETRAHASRRRLDARRAQRWVSRIARRPDRVLRVRETALVARTVHEMSRGRFLCALVSRARWTRRGAVRAIREVRVERVLARSRESSIDGRVVERCASSQRQRRPRRRRASDARVRRRGITERRGRRGRDDRRARGCAV